ncbi:MAG: hypothetical protein JKX80_01490 [Candidatus Pacebacteria bacterium]|nr:hypothetical protein [Candidatus Paceibacterota bacterium]
MKRFNTLRKIGLAVAATAVLGLSFGISGATASQSDGVLVDRTAIQDIANTRLGAQSTTLTLTASGLFPDGAIMLQPRKKAAAVEYRFDTPATTVIRISQRLLDLNETGNVDGMKTANDFTIAFAEQPADTVLATTRINDHFQADQNASVAIAALTSREDARTNGQQTGARTLL